jgi:hypothetical protein
MYAQAFQDEFVDWFVNPKYVTAEEVAFRVQNKRSELR